jgi:hypothetical protein
MLDFSKFYENRENEIMFSEIISLENELIELLEGKKGKKPSKGTTKKERSALAKRAKSGEDIFGGGKNFKKVASKAAKRYGSKDAGKRVAAAIMWKKAGKKGMYAEMTTDDLLYVLDDDLKSILKSIKGE